MRTEQQILSRLQEMEANFMQKLQDVQTAIRVLNNLSMVDDPEPDSPVNTEPGADIPVNTTPARTFADRFCANPNCGDKFTPTHSRQVFCKKDCNPKLFKKKLSKSQNQNDKFYKDMKKHARVLPEETTSMPNLTD